MNLIAKTLSDTAASIFSRTAEITAIVEHGPHFRTIELQGDAVKKAVWAPGHKLQVRTEPVGLSLRTYTPTAWDTATGTTRLLAYAHGNGPGSKWVMAAALGDGCQFFGPRPSLKLDDLPDSMVFAGDETSFASLAAWSGTHPGHQPAVQVFEVDDPDESGRVLETLGLPPACLITRQEDSSHLDELSRAVVDALSGRPDATLCITGKAQTIARVRYELKSVGLGGRRSAVSAYWDQNRKGLD